MPSDVYVKAFEANQIKDGASCAGYATTPVTSGEQNVIYSARAQKFDDIQYDYTRLTSRFDNKDYY